MRDFSNATCTQTIDFEYEKKEQSKASAKMHATGKWNPRVCKNNFVLLIH